MIDFIQARTNMIDGQIHPAGVVDVGILDSFQNIPREEFMPDKLQSVAYTDENLIIGQNRFLLEPIAHAKMLQAAEIKSTDIVLDIGSAYGYSAAILSSLASTVIAVESNKRQIDKAARLWEKHSLSNIVQVENKPKIGAPKHAPYNVIVINGAVAEVPQSILDQLDVGGTLVTVIVEVGKQVGKAVVFRKSEDGNVSSSPIFDAGIPYLEGFEPVPEFQF